METLRAGIYFGQEMKTQENSFLKLSLTRYDENSVIQTHSHANSYLSLLTHGNYVEKSPQHSSLITAGDMLFRPSDYRHQNNFKGPRGTCFNIEFKKGWEEQVAMELPLPEQYAQYSAASFPMLYKLLLHFKLHDDPYLSTEYIYDWLCTISELTCRSSYQPWIAKVASILEHELSTFHSLNSLADRVNVHPVYLARAFKEKKGQTIGEYQLRFKLAHAVSLLLNTSQSITSIAQANGFFDDPHFIRSFKAVYGVSPHRFRLRVKS